MNTIIPDKKENYFHFIRLLAALQVFYGHASEHLFVPMPSGIKEIWWAFRGVPIFFLLSGFLIWNSLERQTSFITYCKKRLLRLYPELWGGNSKCSDYAIDLQRTDSSGSLSNFSAYTGDCLTVLDAGLSKRIWLWHTEWCALDSGGDGAVLYCHLFLAQNFT